MEKIISGTIYSTQNLQAVSQWSTPSNDNTETLYFSDEGTYLLHCQGTSAQMTNEYGQSSYGMEDLIMLDEEDTFGWLEVHDPELSRELFPLEEAI